MLPIKLREKITSEFINSKFHGVSQVNENSIKAFLFTVPEVVEPIILTDGRFYDHVLGKHMSSNLHDFPGSQIIFDGDIVGLLSFAVERGVAK